MAFLFYMSFIMHNQRYLTSMLISDVKSSSSHLPHEEVQHSGTGRVSRSGLGFTIWTKWSLPRTIRLCGMDWTWLRVVPTWQGHLHVNTASRCTYVPCTGKNGKGDWLMPCLTISFFCVKVRGFKKKKSLFFKE